MQGQPAQDLASMVDRERRMEQDAEGVISRACEGMQDEREERAEEKPGLGHCRRFCYGSVT